MGRLLNRMERVRPAHARGTGLPDILMRGAAVLALATAFSPAISIVGPFMPPAMAQQIEQRDPNAQLLLTADELVYDNDAETVTAIGNVQLDYDGYNVVAERVSYNQRTRRVTAIGNVEIIEPDGNRLYADTIDLTDDFGDGFVNALRVETPDNTRIAAESAERFDGQKTVFNHGVYTACEPCAARPDKPPIWQVKAQRVILNGVTKTVTYHNATFELFGLPIAYVPYFSHADPSIKRKSGFLIPTAGYKSDLGYWYRQPYFFKTGDTHDLTIAATGFTKQGFMADLRWRHQLENGFYNLRAAGIRQRDPAEFSTGPDNVERNRAMVATRGHFTINPRWTFGWDVLVQSDNTFSRTYKLSEYSDYNINNEIYLRGLHDRSYFDLSAHQFLIQNSTIVSPAEAFQQEDEQALVRPVLDYNYVRTGAYTGGQWNLDVNLTSLERDEQDLVVPTVSLTNPLAVPDTRLHGIDGETTRISADLQWKKTFNTAAGLMLTPSVSLRADHTYVDAAAGTPGGIEQDGATRFMPTAGLLASYPLLLRTENSSHVIEPMAQVFLRPDLDYDGVLPNEDAQSLVFDATTLFQRDKFSGYDRIESGSRVNVGVRYSGVFGSGITLNALAGQSFHLTGRNPYAREDDLTNTGEESGLETDKSDFVASFGGTLPSGLGFNTQGRFDEDTLDIRRGETSVTYNNRFLSLVGNYTFIDDQPDYGFQSERQQVGFYGSVKVRENWNVFGGAQFNMESGVVVSNTAGLSYTDECFTFSLAFNQTRNETNEVSRSIGFKFSLRTIGEFDGSVSIIDRQTAENGNDF